MVKVLSANIKPHHARPVVYDPQRVYAQVEFYRGLTNIVRQIKGPLAFLTPEEAGITADGNNTPRIQTGDTGDKFLNELIEKPTLFWNWETEIYYGGEIIKSNVTGTDTVKVSVFENSDHGPVILGETGMLPLRFLLDGNKRAHTIQKLVCINKPAGLISFELQLVRRN